MKVQFINDMAQMSMRMSYAKKRLGLLLSLSILSLYFSLMFGTFRFTTLELMQFFHTPTSINAEIFFSLRLPHTIGAFVIGGLLGLSGTFMQAMLYNPLADPYILGISGGTTLFNLIGLLLHIQGWYLILFDYAGSLFAMLIILIFTKGIAKTSQVRLLLIGVMLAAGWGALTSLILILVPSIQAKNFLFWILGDLDMNQVPLLGITILIISLIIGRIIADHLNVLHLGHLQAKTLGLAVEKMQMALFLLTSLLTATAVSLAGPIGFIGLIIPHINRMLFPADYRYLLPAAVLLGGMLLTTADLLARHILAPQQLPVGIFTTLFGIPIFLYLLCKKYA